MNGTSLDYLAKGVRSLRDDGFTKTARRIHGVLSRGHRADESAKAPEADVLFINGCDPFVSHHTRFRVGHQVEQLARVGVSTHVINVWDMTLADEARGKALLFFRCPVDSTVREIIALAHGHGKKVYFDIDDLVIDTSYTDDLPVVRDMSYEDKAVFDDGVRRIGETLRLCDGAITTTRALAGELTKYVDMVSINRNVASSEMVTLSAAACLMRQDEPPRDYVSLGYFGGSLTHNEDFALIVPALAEVFSARPAVRLTVTGVSGLPEELKPLSNRIDLLPNVDWRELPKLYASVDVNLAPLVDTLFNRAKSENKWTEAALVGVPTVASDVGAFAEVIISGKTGILCESTEEWVSALLSLVDDSALLRRIGEAAHALVDKLWVTDKTGYPLAHWLINREFTIESIRDACENDQKPVDTYLSACGITLPSVDFDAAPWECRGLSERVDDLLAAHHAGRQCAAFIYEMTSGDTPTFRYFGHNVHETLAQSDRWYAEYFFVSEVALLDEVIDAVEEVVLVRMRIRPDVRVLVAHLHDAGKPVAYLIDDDAAGVECAPRIVRAMGVTNDDAFGQSFWYGVCDRFGRTAAICDTLIAPTDFLARRLSRRFDKPCEVIHSTLNDEQIEVSDLVVDLAAAHKASVHPFTIAYFSGTQSHAEDFALVSDMLCAFVNAHEDARLLLVGRLSLTEDVFRLYLAGRVILLPPVDYVTLQVIQSSADVILAPLVEDVFTNCKSALKVFEAGAVGTVSIASSTFAYQEAIVNGETGFVCASPDEWTVALERLVHERSLSLDMGKRARLYAVEHYYGNMPMHEAESALGAVAERGVATAELETSHDRAMDEANARSLNWNDQLQINPVYGAALGFPPIDDNRR